MRLVAIFVTLGLLLSCGKAEEEKGPAEPTTLEAPEKAPEPVLKAEEEEEWNIPLRPVEKETKKSHNPARMTAISPSNACPMKGCPYTSPGKGTCLDHPDTDLREQWFVCPGGCGEEVGAGKCKKCGAGLKRDLRP